MPVTFSAHLAHLMQEKPVQISTIFLFEYHWVPIVKAMFFVGYLRNNRYTVCSIILSDLSDEKMQKMNALAQEIFA
jgi:hypothetical protein